MVDTKKCFKQKFGERKKI